MTADFAGQVVLVTGAASGIGRATALAFGEAGASVVALDRSDAVQAVAAAIVESGGAATAVRADVTRGGEVAHAIATAVEHHGRLDCAVNCAGVLGARGRLGDCSDEDWDDTLAINVRGVFLCMKSELRFMLPQRRGAIVNVASMAAFIVLPERPAYIASKHAVVGMTVSAAHDYAADGIRINAVAPGCIDTPLTDGGIAQQAQPRDQIVARIAAQHPLGRMGTPDEVARAALWLCSADASFVTAHVLRVDGGRTIR